MTTRVGIVDYGIGNLKSVSNAVEHIGAVPQVSSDAMALLACDRLILPGVGAFRAGMTALRDSGLDDLVHRFAETGRPFLGICLGMQMLMDVSTEFGEFAGLGLISGSVNRLSEYEGATKDTLRLPNVSWLPLEATGAANAATAHLLTGVPADSRFYFIHSYAVEPELAATAAHSSHDGIRFTSMVQKDNLTGVQFHPEKSGVVGLQMLKNFVS